MRTRRRGSDDSPSGRFEEELRAFGGVDAVVEGSAAGILAFFHAGVAAAKVRHPGRPDLLARMGARSAAGMKTGDRSGLL